MELEMDYAFMGGTSKSLTGARIYRERGRIGTTAAPHRGVSSHMYGFFFGFLGFFFVF